MTLYIDGTELGKVGYILKAKLKVYKTSFSVDPHHSHSILEHLEKFLKNHKISFSKIKKIVVNKGPGSYTGTRVSIAHAMGLSLSLGIPIQTRSKDKFTHEVATIR